MQPLSVLTFKIRDILFEHYTKPNDECLHLRQDTA